MNKGDCLIQVALKTRLTIPELIYFIVMPPPFSMGVHIVSPLFVRMSVPSVHPVRNTNGFHAISFEKIGVLD